MPFAVAKRQPEGNADALYTFKSRGFGRRLVVPRVSCLPAKEFVAVVAITNSLNWPILSEALRHQGYRELLLFAVPRVRFADIGTLSHSHNPAMFRNSSSCCSSSDDSFNAPGSSLTAANTISRSDFMLLGACLSSQV